MSGLVPYALEGVVVGFVLYGRPGPALAVTIRKTTEGRLLAGPAAFCGRVIADLLLFAGLGALAMLRPEVGSAGAPLRAALAVAAGGVLAVLGWRFMNDPVAGALHRDRGGEMVRTFTRSALLDRFLATLISPSWYLFWATGGAWLVLDAARSGPAGVAALCAGMCGTGFLWHGMVAGRLARPRREWALSDRQVRVLTSLGGLLVLAVAVRILVTTLSGAGVQPGMGVRSAIGRIVESIL